MALGMALSMTCGMARGMALGMGRESRGKGGGKDKGERRGMDGKYPWSDDMNQYMQPTQCHWKIVSSSNFSSRTF